MTETAGIEYLQVYIDDLKESLAYEKQAIKQLWSAIEAIRDKCDAWENAEVEAEDAIYNIQDILEPFFAEPDV